MEHEVAGGQEAKVGPCKTISSYVLNVILPGQGHLVAFPR